MFCFKRWSGTLKSAFKFEIEFISFMVLLSGSTLKRSFGFFFKVICGSLGFRNTSHYKSR